MASQMRFRDRFVPAPAIDLAWIRAHARRDDDNIAP